MPSPAEQVTVLRFADGRPSAACCGLLWPAWEWQVIIPRRSARLDLVERAALGLIATRARSAEQLAAVLALDSGVVELVLERLLDDGLLAADGVTTRGLALIRGEGRGERDEELATAFVYVDPFREVLWRYASEDRPAEHEVLEAVNGRARLVGSRGERGANSAWLHIVAPQSGPPARPAALDVLAALRGLDDLGGRDTSLVSYPRALPRLVHLRVFAYVAQHSFADRPWEVTNPFGSGLLPGMRASVELACKLDARLDAEIGRLLTDATARRRQAPLSDVGAATDDLMAAHAEAEAALGRLVAKATDGDRGWRLKRLVLDADRVRMAIASCAAGALESAVAGRPERPWLDVDRATRAAVLCRLVAWLGFDDDLPASASAATCDEVTAALAGENSNLRSLVIAAMFSTHAHPAHPIRSVVASAPDLPAVLLRIAEHCDTPLRMPTDDEDRRQLFDGLVVDLRAAVRVLAPLLGQLRRFPDEESTQLTSVAGARS